MKITDYRRKAVHSATEIRPITMTAARQLPGLLGRVVPAMLKEHGVYGLKDGDARICYLLQEA